MPRIYVATNQAYMAYDIDGAGSDYNRLPFGYSQHEVDFIVVMYALTDFFNRWNKEVDARRYNMTKESVSEAALRERYDEAASPFFKVSTPAAETPRPLPPPILICMENELAIKQLSGQFKVVNVRLSKLVRQIRGMSHNLVIKYQCITPGENLARKVIPS